MNQTDPSRTDDHAAPAAAPAAGAAPGPYAQRLREAYLNEGMALLGEGVPAELIEQTAIELGMPAGPLQMLDEVSLQTLDEALHRRLDGHDHEHGHGHGHGREPAQDHRHGVAHEHEHGHGHGHQHQAHAHGHPHADHAPGPGEAHVHGHNDSSHDGHAHDHVHSHGQEPASAASAPGAAWPPAPPMPESAVYVLEKMAHGYRRMGRAAGRGFYDYLPGEPASLWPGLSAFARGATPISAQDARDRLLYAQAIEAARCLHDGLIGSASEADVGSLREAGFPAWTGGAAHLVDHVGAAPFVERADELAARYGERFRVPASLRSRAADGAR